jgi:hypothetical protein
MHGIKQILSEIRQQPLIWAAAAAGCITGVLFHIPAMPALQDGAAEIIGAAVGAILAVSGAAYVSRLEADRQTQTVQVQLHILMMELSRHLDLLFEKAQQTDKMDGPAQLHLLSDTFNVVKELPQTIKRARQKLEIFVAAAASGKVRVDIAILAVELRSTLDRYSPVIDELDAKARAGINANSKFEVFCTGQCESYYRGELRALCQELQIFDLLQRKAA